MKNILLLILLFSFGIFRAQKSKEDKTKTEIYEKYLKNGAYKYSYFRPEWQKYLDSALIFRPKDAFLWQQKAMPMFKRKKYEVGMQYLDKAVLYEDGDHYLAYRAFIKCIFQKNYQSAVEDFNKLINGKFPRSFIMDHSYYFYRGLSEIQLNLYNEAEKDILQSLKIASDNKFDPHYLELFYLGVIKYEAQDYTAAKNYFDQSLAQYPNFADAQFYLSACFLNLKENAKAKEWILKSSENLSKGNSITEDNEIYEEYPYQVRKWMVDNLLNWLSKD